MKGLINLIGAYDIEAARIAAGVLMCIMGAIAVALIVIVLMQKSAQDDMSSITGESSSRRDDEDEELTNTHFNRSKKMDREKVLKMTTIILGVTLGVMAVIFFIIAPTGTNA